MVLISRWVAALFQHHSWTSKISKIILQGVGITHCKAVDLFKTQVQGISSSSMKEEVVSQIKWDKTIHHLESRFFNPNGAESTFKRNDWRTISNFFNVDKYAVWHARMSEALLVLMKAIPRGLWAHPWYPPLYNTLTSVSDPLAKG